MIETILLDRRNIATELPRVVDAVRSATFVGLDCETHDDDRHPGLNHLMKVNEDSRKKSKNTRLLFDMRRTTVCGFSIYPEGSTVAWYVNLNHADVENRLTFEEAKPILDALPANGWWVCHNAPFEITVFRQSLGYQLHNVICTMQLSVTAFGDDVYPIDTFRVVGLMGMEKMPEMLLKAALRGGDEAYEPGEEDDEEVVERRFSRPVEDLIGKITAKNAVTATNYNGFVEELAYGHGLKELVYKIFGYQMSTFEETLAENAHMGQLTGDQVRDYGAEDAYWVIPLFRHLMDYVAQHSPNALQTFFEQENPMIHVFADVWCGGMRVNYDNIWKYRDTERANYANLLRSLKAALRACPDFPAEPNAQLAAREGWYEKNYGRYRAKIRAFRDGDDEEDDFLQVCQVKGPVSTKWAEERGQERAVTDFSIMHYMVVRTLLYDLLGSKIMFDMGKVASDAEARGRVKTWLEKNDPHPAKLQVLDCLAALSGVETRMKMYLTPYVSLTDPETGYLYPTLNSLLNTRRMAASSPNVLALAKRGESTYVRGFFLGDDPRATAA